MNESEKLEQIDELIYGLDGYYDPSWLGIIADKWHEGYQLDEYAYYESLDEETQKAINDQAYLNARECVWIDHPELKINNS